MVLTAQSLVVTELQNICPEAFQYAVLGLLSKRTLTIANMFTYLIFKLKVLQPEMLKVNFFKFFHVN